MCIFILKSNYYRIILVSVSCLTLYFNSAFAAQSYTPSDVFSGVDYSNRMVDKLLRNAAAGDIQKPYSKEKSAKPMHVYELHISILNELYIYANKNNLRPPPIVMSTPMKYTPTDVYFLTQLVMSNIEQIYTHSLKAGDYNEFSMQSFTSKSPTDVYQKLFELYYGVNRLNGKHKVSPSEVYSHTNRAKEDLQNSLLILSKRLGDNEQDKKRLLVSAIYGMNINGSTMPPLVQGKNPGDVIEIAFDIREKLNKLRVLYKLPTIQSPSRKNFSQVKPIDVFLQTQFIIAELNLLKIPMKIHSTTANVKQYTNKTPSDVYYEMAHIVYMLERLLQVL